MQIYRGRIKLLDYVFFATVERGKIYETGAFIHNYALTYALKLASDVPYAHPRQAPNYDQELSHLNGTIYLTPAMPLTFSHRLVQWNTIREGYAYPGKGQSIGYPDWGFARILRPESEFVFYVLVDNDLQVTSATFTGLLDGRVERIRLGKFPGKASIRLEPAEKMQKNESEFTSHTLLNWRDCPTDPIVCDVLPSSLPTRLINHACFPSGLHYSAHFAGDSAPIQLPANMHYLARPLPQKGKREK